MDLPQPVLPTIATYWPGRILMDISSTMSGEFSRIPERHVVQLYATGQAADNLLILGDFGHGVEKRLDHFEYGLYLGNSKRYAGKRHKRARNHCVCGIERIVISNRHAGLYRRRQYITIAPVKLMPRPITLFIFKNMGGSYSSLALFA